MLVDWVGIKINSIALLLGVLAHFTGNGLALSLSVLASCSTIAWNFYRWRKDKKSK
jgi:hypothetical protein